MGRVEVKYKIDGAVLGASRLASIRQSKNRENRQIQSLEQSAQLRASKKKKKKKNNMPYLVVICVYTNADRKSGG
jgi:hypothetical protein